MQLIDKDALIESFRETVTHAFEWKERVKGDAITSLCADRAIVDFTEAKLRVESMPTVDAEPVRHGKWMKSTERNKEWWWFCSNCQEHYFEDDLYMNVKRFPKYCPNCGAKMGD